jgi:hypothetical protein
MIRPSLVLLGILLGITLGVLYGWVISPVKYVDTDPSSLRDDYKEQYVLLVAAAYRTERDLDRARLRLAKLKDPDPLNTLTALAQRKAAEGEDAVDLAILAADLGGGILPATAAPTSTGVVAFVPSDTPPPPASLAPPTVTPFAVLPPTSTPDFDYALVLQETYCNDDQRQPLIIADVIDSASAPLPGVRLSVTWAEGNDAFVTGLKPEISASYGDFLMKAGTTYSVQIGSRTPPVPGILSPTCTSAGGEPYPGAVRLVFQRR